MRYGDLVSVLVLSYNSAETIVETLQSIYDQTYDNIELIIADDCSLDSTVSVVTKWLENKKNRFSRVQLICNEKNLGTSRNINNAVNSCYGDWIKAIAADDLLVLDCIERYCEKVIQDDEEYSYYLGWLVSIDENGQKIDDMKYARMRLTKLAECKIAREQQKMLVYGDVSLSPSMFVKKETYIGIEGADERIRNIEDHSMRMRLVSSGYMIGSLEHVVAYYRVHTSVSRCMDRLYALDFEKQKLLSKRLYSYPYISKCDVLYWLSEYVERIQIWIARVCFRNNKTKFSSMCIKVVSLFSPRKWRIRSELKKANRFM